MKKMAAGCHYETWQAGGETRPAEYGDGRDLRFPRRQGHYYR
jgi:hypothetical protein